MKLCYSEMRARAAVGGLAREVHDLVAVATEGAVGAEWTTSAVALRLEFIGATGRAPSLYQITSAVRELEGARLLRCRWVVRGRTTRLEAVALAEPPPPAHVSACAGGTRRGGGRAVRTRDRVQSAHDATDTPGGVPDAHEQAEPSETTATDRVPDAHHDVCRTHTPACAVRTPPPPPEVSPHTPLPIPPAILSETYSRPSDPISGSIGARPDDAGRTTPTIKWTTPPRPRHICDAPPPPDLNGDWTALGALIAAVRALPGCGDVMDSQIERLVAEVGGAEVRRQVAWWPDRDVSRAKYPAALFVKMCRDRQPEPEALRREREAGEARAATAEAVARAEAERAELEALRADYDRRVAEWVARRVEAATAEERAELEAEARAGLGVLAATARPGSRVFDAALTAAASRRWAPPSFESWREARDQQREAA